MLIFIATAAAAPGHFHPEDIQVESEVFLSSAQRLQGVFEARSRTLQQYAKALNHYQESLDLLGDRGSEVERTRLAELRRSYSKQEAEVQFAADAVVEDFDTAMVSAMERAAKPFGKLQRCKATIPVASDGPRIPGRTRTQPNPDCEGESLNAKIAARMDADDDLKSAIDDILERQWPTVQMVAEPQPAAGDGITEWVMVRDLVAAVANDDLAEITRRDDERRERIDAALETEGEIDVDALRTEVRRIEQQTAKARHGLAGPILTAADARLAKKAKGAVVGWCANPRTLGGCTGEDATRGRVELLSDDKKFLRALP